MSTNNRFYEAWFDGSTRTDTQCSGVGGCILSPDGTILEEYSESIPYTPCIFTLEYTAFIHIMKRLKFNNLKNVLVYGDSKWVIEKLHKKTSRHILLIDKHIKDLHREALQLLYDSDYYRVKWIPREENERAHRLCKMATRGGKNDFIRIVNHGETAASN